MPKSISKTRTVYSVEKDLKSIIDDRKSGAAALEEKIAKLLIRVVTERKSGVSKNIAVIISKLGNRFGNMANIINFLDHIEKGLHAQDKAALSQSINAYQETIRNNFRNTVNKASYIISRYKSIFTLSNSKTITMAVLGAHEKGWKGKVYIIESRPKRESVIPARKFAGAGIKVIYGTDLNLSSFTGKSEAVLLGADAVTQTYFVNKTGSDMALDYAEKHKIPVYIAADIGKFISARKYIFESEANPEKEVLQPGHENLTIINYYFERIVPRGRFMYVCGDELIRPDQVKNLLKRRR